MQDEFGGAALNQLQILSWDDLSGLLHHDFIFHRHHVAGMNSLGFLLLPHTLNNVPLFAEEVDFFQEESTLAVPIYFQKFVIQVLVVD